MIDITTNSKPQDGNSKEIKSVKIEGDQEIETELELNVHFDSIYRKFAKLCTELKLLYVAITRPKNLLLIYDEDSSLRKPIQTYWTKIGAVNEISKQMSSSPELLPAHIRTALKLDGALAPTDQADQEEIKLKWRLQGFKLFKVKYYQAAMQCFRNTTRRPCSVSETQMTRL